MSEKMFGSQGTPEQIKKAEKENLTNDQALESKRRENDVEVEKVEWGNDLGSVYAEDLEEVLEKNPGWRLPTVKELQAAAISNLEGFVKPQDYWSSDMPEQNPGYDTALSAGKNFVVSSHYGTENTENVQKGITRVRLVRDKAENTEKED